MLSSFSHEVNCYCDFSEIGMEMNMLHIYIFMYIYTYIYSSNICNLKLILYASI